MNIRAFINIDGYPTVHDAADTALMLCSAFADSEDIKVDIISAQPADSAVQGILNDAEQAADVLFYRARASGGELICSLNGGDDFTVSAAKLFDYIGNEILLSQADRGVSARPSQETFKLFGIDAVQVRHILSGLHGKDKGILAFCYGEGHYTTVKLLYTPNGSAHISDIFLAVKEYVYAEEDVTLSVRLLDLLSVRKKTIAVAESITGGAVVKALIDNAGASASVMEAIISYSNESKISRLNVSPNTISQYGAVSAETAYQMAAGLLGMPGTDIAISTTGIAGPGGGTMTKPVGLTYIGVGSHDAIHVYKHVFKGTRTDIRDAAAGAAMFYACKFLKDGGINYKQLIIN